MKRIIIASVLALVCVSAGAQVRDSYGLPRHSLNFQVSDGIGEGFVAVMVDVMAISIKALAGQDTDDELTGWIPYLSAGYDYHFDDTRWSLGCDAGYWHVGATTRENGVKETRHANIGTLAAASKFYYNCIGAVKLYAGVNLGLGVYGVMNDKDEGKSFEKPGLFPAFQINPIGMRVGRGDVAFVAEFGFGYRGIVQLGVNVTL